ncbi:MAG: hypothetical protein KDA86_02440 [Planctomycetaceae bacterium]|nr:hypothetical protein [Planctomycetaceae bacterium]
MPGEQLPRLPRGSRKSSTERNTATFAALIGLFLLAFGFLALVSLVLPAVRGILLLLVAGVGFFTLHYFTWGRVLTRLREKETAPSKADNE